MASTGFMEGDGFAVPLSRKKVKVEIGEERVTVLKGRLKGHFLALCSDSHLSLPFPPTVIPS